MTVWMIPALLVLCAVFGLGLVMESEFRARTSSQKGLAALMMECARAKKPAQIRKYRASVEKEFERMMKNEPNSDQKQIHQLMILKALLLFEEETRNQKEEIRSEKRNWMRKAAMILVKMDSGLYPREFLSMDLVRLLSDADSRSMHWLASELQALYMENAESCPAL